MCFGHLDSLAMCPDYVEWNFFSRFSALRLPAGTGRDGGKWVFGCGSSHKTHQGKNLKLNDLWSPSKPLYKWQWLIWLRFNCISVKVFHVERKRNVAAAALHIILVVFAMKLCNFMWLGLNLWMPWKLWVRLIVLRRRFFQFCKRQPNNPKQIGKKHLYPDDTNYHLLHEWTRAVCRRLPEPSRDSLGPSKSLIGKVHRISKGKTPPFLFQTPMDLFKILSAFSALNPLST